MRTLIADHVHDARGHGLLADVLNVWHVLLLHQHHDQHAHQPYRRQL